eukprot:12921066-Prorocentrum_lima.AAC.1
MGTQPAAQGTLGLDEHGGGGCPSQAHRGPLTSERHRRQRQTGQSLPSNRLYRAPARAQGCGRRH